MTQRWKLWGLLLMALLAGCLNVDGIPMNPFVSATATLQASSTPTPTPTSPPTSTPSPTPVPTPRPDQVLETAQRAEFYGDWDAAIAAYERLRSWSAATQDQVTAATLGLARVYLTAEAYVEAVEVLESFLAQSPSAEALIDAKLLLADGLRQSGDHETAAVYYADVVAARPVLSRAVDALRGDALYATESYTAALEAYDAALQEAETRVDQVFLLEKIALARAGSGDGEGAVAAYDAILAIARVPEYRARIMFEAADTALVFGLMPEAYERMERILVDYPEEPYAHDALVKLVEAGQSVDDMLRGMVNYHAEAYGPAAQAFYRLILGDPNHIGKPHYYAGLSFLEAGSYQLALDEFQLLIETHQDDPYVPDAWLGRAETLAALGDVEMAVDTYVTTAMSYPEHERAPEAFWEAAELLEDEGKYARAAELLIELANRYPDDEGAPKARFRAGLLRYRGDDIPEAQAAWYDLTEWYPYDEQTQAAWFWLGKTHLAAGSTVSATEALSAAVDLGSREFYGLRALDLLEGESAFEAPSTLLVPCDRPEDQEATEAWLAAWLGLDPSIDVAKMPDELLNDDRLRRGTILLRLGHFDEARSDLEALRVATADDPLTQYRLALYFREIGLYRSSIIAASTVYWLSPATTIREAPRFLGCLAYPKYYDELMEEQAAAHGLESLFTYALLRQESLFEGYATSHAAAHGLMQVIPPTGAYIADALGWPPGYQTKDLYRPVISVRFGTWYLAETREMVDGNLFAAMAGYNGGPGNAVRWWEMAEGDADLFVELVDFEETRTYVRAIYQHYDAYTWLHTERSVDARPVHPAPTPTPAPTSPSSPLPTPTLRQP